MTHLVEHVLFADTRVSEQAQSSSLYPVTLMLPPGVSTSFTITAPMQKHTMAPVPSNSPQVRLKDLLARTPPLQLLCFCIMTLMVALHAPSWLMVISHKKGLVGCLHGRSSVIVRDCWCGSAFAISYYNCSSKCALLASFLKILSMHWAPSPHVCMRPKELMRADQWDFATRGPEPHL